MGLGPARSEKALWALLDKAGEEWSIAPAPLGWELAQGGDVVDRVARQGRCLLEYAERMAAIGVIERSVAGPHNPAANRVQQLGRSKIGLLRLPHVGNGGCGGAANKARVGRKQPFPHREQQQHRFFKEEEGDDDDGDDDDDDNDQVTLRARDIVRDWQTGHWTVEEVEAACKALQRECHSEFKGGKESMRQITAIEMLLSLLREHEAGQKWMDRTLEAIVNDGLPSLVRGRIDARVFCICRLISGLAQSQAEHLGRLNVIPRIPRLVNHVSSLDARLIQARYLMAGRISATRSLPHEVGCRRRVTIRLVWMHLTVLINYVFVFLFVW